MGVKMIGFGGYVPPLTASNDDFAKIVETDDTWITTRTGIKNRHLANGELTWQLGAKAARQALEDANLSPEEVDMVIGCTVTGDTSTPSMSCLVAKALGIPSGIIFDINAACAGFVYALDAAEKYLVTGAAETVMIVCAETLSRMVDYTARETCVLFGDGAAAVILRRDDAKLYASCINSKPSGAFKIINKLSSTECPFKTEEPDWGDETANCAPYGKMQMAGNSVYKFAVTAMPEAVEEAANRAGLSINDLDLIIPHQANIRIVQAAIKRLNLPEDKFFVNIADYGNISSACIPFALNQLHREGKLHDGMKLCAVGFGAGLVYAAAVFEV
ncbi:MAG: 3-oxoacyl-ACP synthase III family protein [Oscillospiraceae bacterium]